MMDRVRRREFLSLAAAAPGNGGRPNILPNILMVMADDLSWSHLGAYGDRLARTPHFDRLAAEGAIFDNAFCASPSCAPSRAGLLTGQAIWRLEQGANMRSFLPAKFRTYTDGLEAAGYAIGHTGKGWGPGALDGRKHNPAGPPYPSFDAFLKALPPGKPFCFWAGSTRPHRPYKPGSGAATGKRPDDVAVPPFLSDSPEVRADLLDYYGQVEAFDRDLGAALAALERSGLAAQTLVAVSSDNGMPFPRGKCNLYDWGSRMPLALRWPGRVAAGRRIDDPVCLTDLAPTFLEAAGLAPVREMTGRSLLGLLENRRGARRESTIYGRERHTPSRQDGLAYPCRAIRTREFLYIWNQRPERDPTGDPAGSADIDPGPAKQWMLQHPELPQHALCFGKRPEEELYDLKRDPAQVTNVADRPEYAAARKRLSAALRAYLKRTGDPRVTGDDRFDRYPFSGSGALVG